MELLKTMLNNMKLHTKLVGSYLLLTLIPMIAIFGYFQYRFIYRLEKNTLQMEKVIMDQTADIIENYMSQIENTANIVSQSEIVQQILTCNNSQIQTLMRNRRKRDAVITYMENIHSRIDGDIVQDIKIYCNPDLALFHVKELCGSKIFESDQNVAASLWYGKLKSSNQNSVVASAFYMSSSEIENSEFIAYIRKIPFYVDGEKNTAFAAIYFNQDYLLDVLDGYGDFPDSSIYIMDEKDNIVVEYGGMDERYITLPYQSIDNIIGREKYFSKVNYGNYEEWSIYYNIPQADWKMVFTVSAESIIKSTQMDGFFLMVCYVIIAAIMCILMLALSKSITGRVTMLRDRMVKVKEQLPEELIVPHYYDEIGQLTDSYNCMVRKIQQLIQEKTEMMNEKNKMEMNFLRSQINPHFLYNTLDMISWYAVKGKMEDVIESIQSLAKFYRLSLNDGEVLTTIEKEICLIEKYIEIQKRRTVFDIELIVDIPENMLEQKIPQFILQPLVENSLKHGILEKDVPAGMITFTGWFDQSELVLVLADDGKGMSEDVLKTLFIRDEKEDQRQKEHHIGIWNIYRRLILFYGKEGFSMNYTSSPEEGTSVEIHLSYEINEEVS